MPEDDDLLDGCELDFSADAVDDEEVEYLPLFPDGQVDEGVAGEWRALFGGES